MDVISSISVASGAVALTAMTSLLLLAMPIAFALFWRGKNKGKLKLRYLFVGAAGFMVSARILELGVHMFCIVLDNPVSRLINGSHVAYVLYGITMAGVFEEVGRYVVLKFFLKKERTRENAVLYGIGHGGIEVLMVVLPVYILYLLIDVLLSSGDVSTACQVLNITEETVSATLPMVQTAAAFGIGDGAVAVLERFLCMFVHIGLTMIIHYGVQTGKKRYLLFAVLLHMAVDTMAAVYQRGLVSVWVCEAWACVWTAVIMIFALKLYRRQACDAPGPEDPEKMLDR